MHPVNTHSRLRGWRPSCEHGSIAWLACASPRRRCRLKTCLNPHTFCSSSVSVARLRLETSMLGHSSARFDNYGSGTLCRYDAHHHALDPPMSPSGRSVASSFGFSSAVAPSSARLPASQALPCCVSNPVCARPTVLGLGSIRCLLPPGSPECIWDHTLCTLRSGSAACSHNTAIDVS